MIIKFDPNVEKNIPKFLNDTIETFNNEKYIMFIFNDIYDNVIDIDTFYSKYVSLMERFNLPYAFYPYYIHFNKVLWRSLSYPSPKMHININNRCACDVVGQAAYGMFILDIEKLKSINFKFDETFKLCFYLQEFIEACYNNKLFFSASSYLDVFNSHELVKSSFKDGHFIDVNLFTEEKTKFYSKYPPKKENVQDFINTLKIKCGEIKKFESNDINEDSKIEGEE